MTQLQIQPILLYGAEVWGPYVFTDLSNCEKSETEEVHTQFLERILGCDIRTSNIMTRTELGRRPVTCNIIMEPSPHYIKKIKLNIESLATQALGCENRNNDDNNIFQLVRKFTPCYQVNPETQEMTEPWNKRIHNENNTFHNEV